MQEFEKHLEYMKKYVNTSPRINLTEVSKDELAEGFDAHKVYCSGIPSRLSVVDVDRCTFQEGYPFTYLMPIEFSFRRFKFSDVSTDLSLYFNASSDSLVALAQAVRNSSPILVFGNLHTFAKRDGDDLESIAKEIKLRDFDKLIQPYVINSNIFIHDNRYIDPEML